MTHKTTDMNRYFQAAISALTLTTFLFLNSMNAEAQNQLKAGDRVVFLGDSITQAGARPGGYVSLFRQAVDEQFGKGKVEVIGAGISGHKVPDCQKRLDRDVISKKPTLVMIYIGINDVWHSTNGRGTSKEDFESGLKDLIKRCTDAGSKVVLCTPSVIGEKTDGSNRLDKMLEEYSGISRGVAKAMDIQMLDLRKAFVSHLKEHNKGQKPHSILTTDGVHLNASGNKFVAKVMGEAVGVKQKADPKKLLRHIVMFKFQSGAKEADVKKVVDAFKALPKKIDAIHDFESGVDVSVEGKAKGFTHCFVVTFRTDADRQIYLPHPEHKKFVELLKPVLDDVLVFDYWTGE